MKRIPLIIVTTFLLLCIISWGVVDNTSAGGTSSKAASSTLTRTYQKTIAAGNLFVVCVATDNIGAGADGDNGDIVSVADDAGNTFTKAVIFSNTQAGAANGATTAIYYCLLTNGVTTGTTLTVTFNGSPVAKAMIGQAFTLSLGTSVTTEGSAGTLANDGADAGSITLSSLPSRSYLFIRATASEQAQAAGTKSTGYTTFGNGVSTVGTSGGGGASNMELAAEYIIATATSQSSDPSVGAADAASAMVAFYEFTAAANPRRVTIISKP